MSRLLDGLAPHYGNHRPAELYAGSRKIAGWTWREESGAEIAFECTYNDTASLMARGTNVFVPDWLAMSGLSAQGGEPSVDNPQAVVPGVSTGTYRFPCSDARGGWWELKLDSALHGIGAYQDSLIARKSTGLVERVRRIQKLTLDGSESWMYIGIYGQCASVYVPKRLPDTLPAVGWKQDTLCTHFAGVPSYQLNNALEGFYFYWYSDTRVALRITLDRLDCTAESGSGDILAAVKEILSAQAASGTPVTVYYPLAEPVVESLTASWKEESNAPDLPASALNTPDVERPFRLEESGSIVTTEGGNMPNSNVPVVTQIRLSALFAIPDANGGWSCRDELFIPHMGKAELTRHVRRIEFDGNETGWMNWVPYNSDGCYELHIFVNGITKGAPISCSHLPNEEWVWSKNVPGVASSPGSNGIYVKIPKNLFSLELPEGYAEQTGADAYGLVVAAWQEWLNAQKEGGTPFTVCYQVETPDAEQISFEPLKTYPRHTRFTISGETPPDVAIRARCAG